MNNDNNLSANSPLLELQSEATALCKLLDEKTNMIRNLEKSLQDLNANFPFLFFLKKDEVSIRKRPEGRHLLSAYEVKAYTTQICWYLSWDKDEASKTYRLLLISKEVEIIWFETPSGSWHSGDFQSNIVFKRPLIETDRQTRLQYSKELEPFINAFTEFLNDYRISILFSS